MFWLTELVSAFITMPPRNMVKFCAMPCIVHTGCAQPRCAFSSQACIIHGKGSQPGIHVAADTCCLHAEDKHREWRTSMMRATPVRQEPMATTYTLFSLYLSVMYPAAIMKRPYTSQ